MDFFAAVPTMHDPAFFPGYVNVRGDLVPVFLADECSAEHVGRSRWTDFQLSATFKEK
jgi:hypothetical protein